MQDPGMLRRALLKTALAVLGTYGVTRRARVLAAPAEIKVPDLPAERFDFETKGIEGWTAVDGSGPWKPWPALQAGGKCLSSGP